MGSKMQKQWVPFCPEMEHGSQTHFQTHFRTQFFVGIFPRVLLVSAPRTHFWTHFRTHVFAFFYVFAGFGSPDPFRTHFRTCCRTHFLKPYEGAPIRYGIFMAEHMSDYRWLPEDAEDKCEAPLVTGLCVYLQGQHRIADSQQLTN